MRENRRERRNSLTHSVGEALTPDSPKLLQEDDVSKWCAVLISLISKE
jgi:hypothetical protein